MPLHADIVVRAREIGFETVTPILWHKIANASYEVENRSRKPCGVSVAASHRSNSSG
jgi:hypothetical protein